MHPLAVIAIVVAAVGALLSLIWLIWKFTYESGMNSATDNLMKSVSSGRAGGMDFGNYSEPPFLLLVVGLVILAVGALLGIILGIIMLL